jgi:hypothetical protein
MWLIRTCVSSNVLGQEQECYSRRFLKEYDPFSDFPEVIWGQSGKNPGRIWGLIWKVLEEITVQYTRFFGNVDVIQSKQPVCRTTRTHMRNFPEIPWGRSGTLPEVSCRKIAPLSAAHPCWPSPVIASHFDSITGRDSFNQAGVSFPIQKPRLQTLIWSSDRRVDLDLTKPQHTHSGLNVRERSEG